MIDTARQIVWFEEVTRDDVPSVGGKNASLGEMISRTHRKRRQNALWICDDGASLLALHRQQWRAECHRRGARRPRIRPHRARRRRSNNSQRRSPRRMVQRNGERHRRGLSRAGPARRQKRARCRGEVERHRRRPAECELRGTAGDLSEHSRRAGVARRLSALLRIALHGSRDKLSQGSGFRPYESRAVGRRAAHGPVRHRRRGRDVLAGHGDGLRQGRAHQRLLGLGENVVQGAVDPDEYVVFKRPLQCGAVADHREETRRQAGEDDLCAGRRAADAQCPDVQGRARLLRARRRGHSDCLAGPV